MNSNFGHIYVNASKNNTFITATTVVGDTICWSSSGSIGFKGSRRSTAYAAQIVAEDISQKAYNKGLRTVNIFLKGFGRGRNIVPKFLRINGLVINKIIDTTAYAHGGCRPKKIRRI